MGVLERYSEISNHMVTIEKKPIREPEELNPVILPDDSKCITLSEFSPVCSDVIRVHTLSNYRRRPEVVTLVPDLKVEIDFLMFDREELLECTPIL